MKEKNTYQKNSILLFGGCGKLGKYIIENLNIEKDQSELYILDLNQPEINDNFTNFNFIQCNANNIDELTEKIAGLIHKSSQLTVINLIGFDFPVNKNKMQYDSPVSISQDALRKSLELNLETSHKIVQSVIKFEKQSHFIFFSSIFSSHI